MTNQAQHILRVIPLEYSCLDKLHCKGISDKPIIEGLEGQRDADEAILKDKYISKEEHKRVVGEIFRDVERLFVVCQCLKYIPLDNWKELKQKYLGGL